MSAICDRNLAFDWFTEKMITHAIWQRDSSSIFGVRIIQGRIQEFILGGGPNQGPQSKVKGEARIEGAKRPSIEGEARVEGAKRSRIEGEARTEGEAREKSGEGSGEGARWALPRKFLKNQTWNHSFWCIFEAIIWED